LPTCCEQRVTYLVIGISDLELESTFLEQKLSNKVQVLNANLVAMCMPYDDAYHTRSAMRNAGASVQRADVVRQAQKGSQPRPVVRNVQAVIGI
jgi:hypothetical protein